MADGGACSFVLHVSIVAQSAAYLLHTEPNGLVTRSRADVRLLNPPE